MLWKPPIKVVNLKEVFDRDFLYDASGYSFVNGCSGRVGIHGSVRYSVSCPLDFKYYPFDQQRCELQIVLPAFNDLQLTSSVGVTIRVVVAAAVVAVASVDAIAVVVGCAVVPATAPQLKKFGLIFRKPHFLHL